MANKTKNYNLTKPTQDEFYDIEVQNSNMDTIDSELKKRALLDSSGKVSADQLPNMNYDPAGSAAEVQVNLNSHTGNKDNPHGVTKMQIGLGNVPNVNTNSQTPTYTVATENSALVSGEKLSVAFGKIAKAISSLIAHIANTSNPHGVTAGQIGAIATSQRGAASGVAPLDSNGKVPSNNLPEIASVSTTKVTLTSAGWVLESDERYSQTVSAANVAADSKMVIVDIDLTTSDVDAKIAYLGGWSSVSTNEVVQGAGTLKFYAWEKPTVNLPVNVGVM
jgi:hypothetical protein